MTAVSTLRPSDLPTLDPGDWLPVSEAAGLTGLSERHWRRRAVALAPKGLASLAPSGAEEAAGGGRPNCVGRPTWWVHRSVDVRLSRCPAHATRDERKRVSLLADNPHHHVERAYRKCHWMQEWRKRCRKPRVAGRTDLQIADTVAVEARRIEGNGFRISARSLQIWHTAYNSVDVDGVTRGVAALVDRYGSREILKPGDGQTSAGRCAEAIGFFKKLYETENKISLALAHELTVEESDRNQWVWPESYTATIAWWRRTNDRSRTCLTRQGKSEWSHTFMPHMERDWTRVAVGSVFIADHRKCDFWVTHNDSQIRPWITAIADGRSRYIVGWRLSASPNQDTILAALLMAFRDCAVPEHLYIDNGKDFRCNRIVNLSRTELRNLKREHGDRWRDVVRRDRDRLSCDDPRWLGIVPELGVDITYALPYSPWSKPIERWFRTMKERCDKLVVTYCGDSPRTRPECLGDIREGRISSKQEKGRSAKKGLALIDTAIVPTFDEAVEHVGAFIERYHRHPHRGRGMRGCSPLAVWNTATSLRKADADALACLVAIRGSYRVQSNGVTVQMDGGRFSYGSNSANLRRYVGKEVLVAVDLSHPTLCWAVDKDTRRRIDRLEPNEYMHPMATHEDLRDQVARKQRAKAIEAKAQRTSATRTCTATQLANQAARSRDRRLAELGATGTEDASQRPNILPVSTGFEGVSVPVQSPFEPHSAGLPDAESVADLFAPLEPSEPDDAAGDITDLLRDDVEEESENDFAELL